MDVPITSFPSSAKRIDVRKSGINRLSPLFQTAPGLVTASEVASERYMRVVVNGPLTLAKDGNGFRGIVHGADGKISEHVRLFEGELSQVVNSAALFNVASMALAQKHLADISERLDEIKEGVDEISTFLTNEREAEITGAIQYLRQVADPIMGGELRPALEQQLEDSEKRLLAVQGHLKADIIGLIAQAAEAKDEGKFGTSVFRERLVKLQVAFDETVHQWKLCLAARMMACRLLCNFSGTVLTVESREQSIRNDAEWLIGPHGALSQFEAAVLGKLSAFSALGDSKIELAANRESVRITHQSLLPALRQDAAILSAQFDRLMNENRMPVELLVAVRGGEVFELAAA